MGECKAPLGTHISSFCKCNQETLGGHGAHPHTKAAPVSNQLTLYLWSNANVDDRSSTLHHKHTTSAVFRDFLYRPSQKTPGWFSPDLCTLILYLTSSMQFLLSAVSSEFCLRNAPAQKKYWHNREWVALHCTAAFYLSCEETLALSDWPGLISGLWTSFQIIMETKPGAT